jgi:Ca2+-binding RTX toxin-like protein
MHMIGRHGDDGDDWLWAGDGNDVLYGGDDADHLFADDGDRVRNPTDNRLE